MGCSVEAVKLGRLQWRQVDARPYLVSYIYIRSADIFWKYLAQGPLQLFISHCRMLFSQNTRCRLGNAMPAILTPFCLSKPDVKLPVSNCLTVLFKCEYWLSLLLWWPCQRSLSCMPHMFFVTHPTSQAIPSIIACLSSSVSFNNLRSFILGHSTLL